MNGHSTARRSGASGIRRVLAERATSDSAAADHPISGLLALAGVRHALRIPLAPTLAAAGVLALAAVESRMVLRIVCTVGGWAFVRTLRGPAGERVRVLSQGGVYQSASYVGARRSEPVFAYIEAFDAVFAAEGALCAATGHGVERVLALGGGGFSWPKHALTSHLGFSMDVVETDPVVVAAARRWFFLDELERRVGGRLHVIETDGRAFLEERAARIAGLEADMTLTAGAKPDALRYDAIVNDNFIGGEPVRALVTVEAA